MTAETSNARGDAEYEYEVWQGDALQAGGSTTDYASAQSEAGHYAMMYASGGPVEVRIYEKRLLTAPPADQGGPKRRPYNTGGSLSEYGIFPECDAANATARPQAEIEALRAEVATWEGLHASEVQVRQRWQARAERLAEEVEALRAEVGELHMHAKRRDQYAVEKAAQALDWKKRAERLAEVLREARDAIEDWAGYASDYFREKHDLAGDLAKIDALLRDQEEGK